MSAHGRPNSVRPRNTGSSGLGLPSPPSSHHIPNSPWNSSASTSSRPQSPYTRFDLSTLKHLDIKPNHFPGQVLELSTSQTFKNLYELQTQLKARLNGGKKISSTSTSTPSPLILSRTASKTPVNNAASQKTYRPMSNPCPLIQRSYIAKSTVISASGIGNRILEEVQTVLPKRASREASTPPIWNRSIASIASYMSIAQSSDSSLNDNDKLEKKEKETKLCPLPPRPQTAPEACTTSSAEFESREIVGCLKNSRPSSKPTRQSVTFAPETLNIERESKPKKIRVPKNNRRQKYAHPCRGHFVPPEKETVTFHGPEGPIDNLYSQFTSVWCPPSMRISKESTSKHGVRIQRFKKVLSDLSIAHDNFNDVVDNAKAKVMIEEILPRYIIALDISLMDAAYEHTEQLLITIVSSIRILQINLHDEFFDPQGNPRMLLQVPPGNDSFFVKLGPLIFALNRICDKKFGQYTNNLAIEPQLVKLQLELLVLCISPRNCLMFRSILAVVPSSARRALELFGELKDKFRVYSVKWVNDSVMHRDYMATMKYLHLCDEFGAVEIVPHEMLSQPGPADDNDQGQRKSTPVSIGKRPSSPSPTSY